MGIADSHCPTTRFLENEFYPNAKDIVRKVEEKLGLKSIDLQEEEFFSHEHKFKGPF